MDDPQLSREWEDEMLLTRMILVNKCDEEGVGTPTLACHAWLILKLWPNLTFKFLFTTTTSLSLLWIICANNPFHFLTNCLGSSLAVIPPHSILFTAVNLAQLLGSLLQFNSVALINIFLSAYNQLTLPITVWDHLKQIWHICSVCNSRQLWFL